MTPPPDPIITERLTLRRWRDEDRAPFAALNADPEVMRNLPAPLSRTESDAFVDRIEANFIERGYGLWVVEPGGTSGCVGYVGLWPAPATLPVAPAVEVGWRLAASSWGQGYAPEAARAALADGFDRLRLDAVVSFTWEGNMASRRVMEKLGMTHDPADDFDHTNLPVGHRLRPHVLYRLQKPEPGV